MSRQRKLESTRAAELTAAELETVETAIPAARAALVKVGNCLADSSPLWGLAVIELNRAIRNLTAMRDAVARAQAVVQEREMAEEARAEAWRRQRAADPAHRQRVAEYLQSSPVRRQGEV